MNLIKLIKDISFYLTIIWIFQLVFSCPMRLYTNKYYTTNCNNIVSKILYGDSIHCQQTKFWIDVFNNHCPTKDIGLIRYIPKKLSEISFLPNLQLFIKKKIF